MGPTVLSFVELLLEVENVLALWGLDTDLVLCRQFVPYAEDPLSEAPPW